MADGTATLRNTLYDAAFRDQTVYLGLFSSADPASELTVSGYARQVLAFGAPTDGAGDTDEAIAFGPLLGAGGTISHAALFDAASGGTRLTAPKALAGGSVAWVNGMTLTFAAGDVDGAVA